MYTIGNASAPAETPSRAYRRFATVSDTTNDVAVMAVESRPRTVASWTLSGKSRDAAIMNGNDTEKSRTASSTYASATRRIRGDRMTVSNPARRSLTTEELPIVCAGRTRGRGSRASSPAASTRSTAWTTTSDSTLMIAATGPAASVPRKLPTIAALVRSGKSRFAWRASNAAPLTVHAIVKLMAPDANTVSQTSGTSPVAPIASPTRCTTSRALTTPSTPVNSRTLGMRPSATA